MSKSRRKAERRRRSIEAKASAASIASAPALVSYTNDAKTADNEVPPPAPWFKKTELWMVVFTCVLTATAISQCVITKGQLAEMQGTTAQTDKIIATYEKANAMNQESLALTKKQVMSAHVPWVGIESIRCDTAKKTVTIEFKNYSDSPALNVVTSMYPANEQAAREWTFAISDTPHILYPLQQQEAVFEITNNNPTKLDSIVSNLLSGKSTVRCVLSYEDVYARKFRVLQVIQGSSIGSKHPLGVGETTFEGLDQLR